MAGDEIHVWNIRNNSVLTPPLQFPYVTACRAVVTDQGGNTGHRATKDARNLTSLHM
jgi:hypothetical protein